MGLLSLMAKGNSPHQREMHFQPIAVLYLSRRASKTCHSQNLLCKNFSLYAVRSLACARVTLTFLSNLAQNMLLLVLQGTMRICIMMPEQWLGAGKMLQSTNFFYACVREGTCEREKSPHTHTRSQNSTAHDPVPTSRQPAEMMNLCGRPLW